MKMFMNRGYAKIPTEIAKMKMSDGARSTLLILRAFSNSDGTRCFPSRNAIAKIRGCHIKTVDRSLKELKEMGLIDWQRGHKGLNNLYRFLFIGASVSRSEARGVCNKGASVGPHLEPLPKSNYIDEHGNDLGFIPDDS